MGRFVGDDLAPHQAMPCCSSNSTTSPAAIGLEVRESLTVITAQEIDIARAARWACIGVWGPECECEKCRMMT